uniref:SANT domain-containing protein n=1 Tax=Angiostrongylus cantonensis TaxID=6313 RepID=A0A0K0DF31_ANGCA
MGWVYQRLALSSSDSFGMSVNLLTGACPGRNPTQFGLLDNKLLVLYLLQKSNIDFNVAQEKVRRPINEEWNEGDRALFKQILLMFGKRFDKIRQMPCRSVSSVIQFYYNTKKDTDYKSSINTRMAEDSEDDV